MDKYNHELVEIHRVNTEAMEAYRRHLREMIEAYVAATGSARGAAILEDFSDYARHFWLVKPKAASWVVCWISLGVSRNNRQRLRFEERDHGQPFK